MRTGEASVAPVSARGLLFLLAFVAFLALSVLGPHVHGADAAPVVAANVAAAQQDAEPSVAASAAVAATVTETVTALRGESGSSGDQALGFGAVCVLVLVASIALLAVRGTLGWAPLRRSLPRWLTPRPDAPRGSTFPLTLLLSVSRT
ncbi:MAG: hypothetical protein ACTH30_06355 [Leucobacter sp.]